MYSLCRIVVLFLVLSVTKANYHGPFILWGSEEFKGLKLPTLQPINGKTLISAFTNAKAIIIFLHNTSSITYKDFPQFKKLVDNNNWIYAPQKNLAEDPFDYNPNIDIIHLIGDSYQQDSKLISLYNDAIKNYGSDVLGILAIQPKDHSLFKRDAADKNAETTTINPTDEPMKEDFIYIAEGKAILYTTSAPILTSESNTTDEKPTIRELKVHGIVTFDDRLQRSRLVVTFKTDEGKLILRFRFQISSGYWSLTSVEVEEKDFYSILPVVGQPPTAPIGFSHKCSGPLVFRNGTNSLTMENVQTQPLLAGENSFSDAYDCVGFTTAPIWSGIFVTSFLLIVLTIAIVAIVDIKTPTKFETNRTKLTFGAQE